MTAPRKLQGLRILPLCLLLASAGALAETRDVRMHGPNGDGGECSEDDAGTAAASASPAPKTAAGNAKPAGAAKIKPVVTVRGGDDGHPPRWHSFLPGMFR